MKAFLIIAATILFFGTSSFAEQLAATEAINYYREGVRFQKGGDYVKAETFFQKALLVDPGNPKWKKLILNNRE